MTFRGHGWHAHNSVPLKRKEINKITIFEAVSGLKIESAKPSEAMNNAVTSLSLGNNSGQATM